MDRLKVFEAINDPNRISSVDIFRCIAIVAVVLYHFNFALPFGFIGVDLFFIISGLLVGGILTKELQQGNKINFFRFFILRGFKIWPSYYVFLFLGGIVSWALYNSTHIDQIIPFWDLKRYIFFYQNFTGKPLHWSFDHVWSLCVEEHFYVILPVIFLIIQNFIKPDNRIRALFVITVLMILAGVLCKNLAYYFTNSKDIYAATYNRIDALAWGVLLNLIITFYGEKLKSKKFSIIMLLLGLLTLMGSLLLSVMYDNHIYEKVYFHSIIPISFFLIMLGSYYIDFSKLKPLRFIAYYSYNWYLWHALFVIFITDHLGNSVAGFVTFFITTFLVAVLATILVEEPVLRKRKVLMDILFKKRNKVGDVISFNNLR